MDSRAKLIPAGSFVTSRLRIGMDTGINESKVERILKCFESEQQIEQQGYTKYRVISITNWNKYQGAKQENEQQMNSKRTTNEQQMNTDKNDKNNKNDNNDKKEDKYMSTFEELWKEYPNKDGKKEAIRHFKTTVKTDADRLNVKKALLNYLQSTNVKKGFIKNGSTWFNNWQDWIDFTGAAIEEKPPSIDDIPDYKPGMTYQEFKSQVKK